MTSFRAAVVQDAPVPFDTPATLERLRLRAAEAARWGAALAVFPEAFLGGYPKGQDFGTRVGFRTPAGRRLFERYAEAAIAVPGPETARVGEVARELGLHLVVGAIERAGGSLYGAALTFGPDGTLLFARRKLTPTALERLIWGAGDGSDVSVVPTTVGRLAPAICWESYQPLFRTALYARGVEVYCALTVDDRDTWLASMRHVAAEGRCFVLSSCQYATRREVPFGLEAGDADPGEVLIRGGSCVVSPLGEVLAGPLEGGPGVLLAEVDLGEVTRGKLDLDVVGHSARPDVFRLEVRTGAALPVSFLAGDAGPGPRDGSGS